METLTFKNTIYLLILYYFYLYYQTYIKFSYEEKKNYNNIDLKDLVLFKQNLEENNKTNNQNNNQDANNSVELNKMNKNNKLKNNFLWGVSTSSHQIEGNNQNNWTLWEYQENLEKSSIATNSWEYFDDDLENIKSLGVNTYRFSIEWSRIFPEENHISEFALDKYENWCKKLIENNITPMISLHHFTRPIWVEIKYGGFHNEKIIPEFLNYVKVVVSRLHKYVKYWVTFNEPLMELVNGYLVGSRPPGYNDNMKYLVKALKNICVMHARCYHLIHFFRKDTMVGLAKNLSYVMPYKTYEPLKSKITAELDRIYNIAIIEALTNGVLDTSFNFKFYRFGEIIYDDSFKNTLDFIGVNHYNIGYIEINYYGKKKIDVLLSDKDSDFPKNDMNWDMCPYSMYKILKNMGEKYPNIPLIITENGCCDNSLNKSRARNFLKQNMLGVKNAMNEGINIIGYYYWTLHDNFEWNDGYAPKFGLFTTNFYQIKKQIKKGIKKDTSKKINPIGKLYQKIIRINR